MCIKRVSQERELYNITYNLYSDYRITYLDRSQFILEF